MEEDEGVCDNNSVEINSDNEFEDDTGSGLGNPKLADALNKVLRMAQKKNSNKSIVLSKAKLHDFNKQVKKETCEFEIEPDPNSEVVVKEEEENIKPDLKPEKKSLKKTGLTRHEKLKRGRVIPSILGREKEKQLARVATRGVVQLFNAVRQQQSYIEKQFKENKLTEAKKEKILKSVDRKGFLNAISGFGNISLKTDISEETREMEIKEEKPDIEEDKGEKPSWEVLRSDFMMGAKLKDWDKKANDEELSS